MRISDWSSDVCSSDLGRNPRSVVPVERIGVAPVFLAAAALSPPVLPRRREARHRGDRIAAMKGEQIHVRIAVEPPRRTGRKPGTRLRPAPVRGDSADRSEEHTSELQSLMRISYAVFCLKQKTIKK